MKINPLLPHVWYTLIPYQRIEDEGLLRVINKLYEASNLLNNFFCSNRKVIFKEKHGAKYYKRYDAPATACERLLASGHLTEPQKTHLTEVKLNLDPYKLRKLIDAKLRTIFSKLR